MKKKLNTLLFIIQRKTHIIQLRGFICFLLRIFLPNRKKVDGFDFIKLNKDENQIYKELQKEGFSNLGVALNEQQLDNIINQILKLDCYEDRNPKQKVDLDNVSEELNLALYNREDLLKINEIIEIANDKTILNAVSKYFKIKPTISNINCWWSFGDRNEAKEAQFYHRDLDDFKFLKMFFYLTDVNEDSGPHVFVLGSHKVNKLLELRRFTDKEVIDNFNDNIKVLTAPKGSCFIEDTYGIHKGQLPKKGRRLILQVQYSYLPLYVEKYNPISVDETKYEKINKYINRLLLTFN